MVEERPPVASACEGRGQATTAVVRQEEVVEIALAAAGSALLASLAKGLLLPYAPLVPRFVPPSPLLFLLLHLVIASIAFVSTGGSSGGAGAPAPPPGGRTKEGKDRERGARAASSSYTSDHAARADAKLTRSPTASAVPAVGGVDAVEERRRRRAMVFREDLEGAEEVDARAEAFIAAFRRQLVFDAAAAASSSPAGCRRRHSFRY